MMSNIFVTGIGLVTPFGRNIADFWSRIIGPTSAIRRIQDSAFSLLPCQIAATIDPFSSPYEDQPAFIKYAMCAADDAIADADLLSKRIDSTRIVLDRIIYLVGSLYRNWFKWNRGNSFCTRKTKGKGMCILLALPF